MPAVLQRQEIGYLKAWAARRPHKPIVIRGARQVGKSTLVREFARAARLTLMDVDFERNPELRDAFTTRDPARILELLKLLTGKTAATGTHLLFLDEIQAAPEALAALRYFREEMPELHVLAAGSLLEFALADTRYPMPVGRVEYMHLGPMHFEDFVIAMGEAGAGRLPARLPAAGRQGAGRARGAAPQVSRPVAPVLGRRRTPGSGGGVRPRPSRRGLRVGVANPCRASSPPTVTISADTAGPATAFGWSSTGCRISWRGSSSTSRSAGNIAPPRSTPLSTTFAWPR